MTLRRRPLRIGALAAWLVMLSFAVVGRAQEAPIDPGATSRERPTIPLPPPPEGFLTRRTEGATWTFPPHARELVDRLEEVREDRWREITDDLGAHAEGGVVIRIARNTDEMKRMAPVGMPPPSYASGVAYPAYGLVLLTLTTSDPNAPIPDLDTVFVHELSHVALYRAAGPEVPRWLAEGLAIRHAREQSMSRLKTLWEATAQRRLVPLRRLPAAFADGSDDVDVAYAQSADLVAYMLGTDHGLSKMQRLVQSLNDGKSFPVALENAYFLSLNDLEREWKRDLWERHSTWPLIVGGTGLWVVATIVLAIGYLRKRRIAKGKLARWGREEAAMDQLTALLEAKLQAAETEAATRTPVASSDSVPTVRHDGDDHTLH